MVASNALQAPFGIAADSAANIYIADTLHNAIKKWSPGNSVAFTVIREWAGQSLRRGGRCRR